MLLLVYYVNVETEDSAFLLSKEARMTPLEPNPLSIRHDVVFADQIHCQFDMTLFLLSFVSLACKDGRL